MHPVTKFAIFESQNAGLIVWVSTHDTIEAALEEQSERLAEKTVDEGEVSFIQPVLAFVQAL